MHSAIVCVKRVFAYCGEVRIPLGLLIDARYVAETLKIGCRVIWSWLIGDVWSVRSERAYFLEFATDLC